MLSLRNFSSAFVRALPATQVPAVSRVTAPHRLLWRAPLYAPIFVPFAPRISRYSTATAHAPEAVPATLGASVPSTERRRLSASQLKTKIVEKAKEELHRLVEGSKQLGRNTKTAATLLHGVLRGNTLTRRERLLMIRTVSDLIRMVPFIVIVVVPFAEFALPVLLKLFPNMLPSTFTSASQKEAAQTRTLRAKLEVIKVLQAASEDLVMRNKLASKDMQAALVSFMSKVSRGEEIAPQEILTISKNFANEFSLSSLERPQLQSLARFFGLPPIGTSFILQEELKFKWNLVKQDDQHILREGIHNLSPSELEEAAYARGYSPATNHLDKAQYLQQWISLSQENVPPYLLLLSRAQFFVNKTKEVTDIRPPVIATFLPPLPEAPAAPSAAGAKPKQEKVDLPEKELISVDFKNHHHEFSHDPVVAKLWVQIARFTRDLKKETFGGKTSDVIYLGDSTGDKLSTVITRDMRQYLQAIFLALDKDGDRKLSVDEVENGLRAADIPAQRSDVMQLVRLHDTDGDNSLSFDEFVDLLLYIRKYRN